MSFFKDRSWSFDHHLAKIPYRVRLTITLFFCISVLFLLYTAWFNISLLNCVTSYHILCAERKQINCYTVKLWKVFIILLYYIACIKLHVQCAVWFVLRLLICTKEPKKDIHMYEAYNMLYSQDAKSLIITQLLNIQNEYITLKLWTMNASISYLRINLKHLLN